MASLGAATLLLLLAVAIGGPVLAVRINSERRRAEQNLYASDMNLAFKSLEAKNRGQVLRLLERHRPRKPRDRDLRGWEWRYLWKQTRSDELASLPESRYEIQCLTFSPDGKYLATAEARGRISIWDLATTQRVAECQSPSIPALLKFSSDARHLVSANFKNGLWVWDWNPPQLSIHGPPLMAKGIVNGIDLREGIVTAVDQDQKLLRRWELLTGRELPGFPIVSEMDIHNQLPWSAFSPDGRLIATTSNNIVMLWNRQTGVKLTELSGSDSMVVPLAFSPDSHLIVAISTHGICDIWETETFRKVASFSADPTNVDKGKFSPDGKQFVTASYDHTLKVWDTSDWRNPVTLRGHLGEVYDAAFSPDGKFIASASADGTVRFWSASPKPHRENFQLLPTDVRSWSLSPGGLRLFLIFTDHTFSLWDLNTGDESLRQRLPSDKSNIAALFADGRRVALGATDGAVKVLDLRTMMTTPMQTSFSNAVMKVSSSADGRTIVAQSTNDVIKAWQVSAGRELATFSAENNYLLDRLPISPDGRFVATAPIDGTTEFWELSNLNKRTIASDKLYTSGVAFFRDGRVATSSINKTAQVWDLNTRHSLRKMYSDQTGLRSVALSPDERRLAAGDDLGSPGKVKVWDIDLEYEVAVLSGHKESIIDVAFWPDGNTIVSVSSDKVFIWRAASFDEIAAAEKAERASLSRASVR
jgi:WD40 repeat protein